MLAIEAHYNLLYEDREKRKENTLYYIKLRLYVGSYDSRYD